MNHEVREVLAEVGLPAPAGGWRDHATCADIDPAEADQVFYPRATGRGSPAARAMEVYCDHCPVWVDCLAAEFAGIVGDAKSSPRDLHGVRGGLAAHERRGLLADAIARAAAKGVVHSPAA